MFTAIIILILLGILLLWLEFFVIPGTTIAGFAGAGLLGVGIYLSYRYYGATTGNITLVASLALLAISLILAFRSKTWNKLMLKDSVDSKIKNFEETDVTEGDSGITISRLAPMGKVLINDKYIEAQSNGELIDQNKEIVVIKVFKNKIIVKLKN